MEIAIIGAGNVAIQMGKALSEAGHTIRQVWSRTPAHAEAVAGELGAVALTELGKISPGADFYIFCVKDDALTKVIDCMPDTGGVWAHTGGSLSMELFAGRTTNYGVLYPLQTFSRRRSLSFAEIPLFVEGNHQETTTNLEQLARTLSRSVYRMPEEKRKKLHLAAVFACNFVNHLYARSAEIIGQEIPFDLLLPLIRETAAKLEEMPPLEAQTGPAMRGDLKVMRQQLEQIVDPRTREIYRLLSESIAETTKRNNMLS